MKILHVSHGFLPECSGGVEFYLRELLAAQQDAGQDVVLVSGCVDVQESCGYEEVDYEGLRVVRLWRDDWYHDHYARAWHPEIERLFAAILERERPDVVHVHQWIRLTNNLVEVAERVGIAAVVTLHDVYTSCPRAFRVHKTETPCFRDLSTESCVPCAPRFGHETDSEVAESVEMFRETYRSELLRARRVLVAMQSTGDLIARTANLPPELFTAIGLGYRRRLTQAVAATPPTEAFRFAHWGTLVVHKGVVVLLDALRELTKSELPRPVELHLFGPVPDPHFESILHERAQGLPVTFHGRYELANVAALGAHASVFPSTCFETYGLALAESFELGWPTIVSDLGALPERAGGGGLKVRAGDVADLAGAMGRLVRDPVLLAELRSGVPSLPDSPDLHAARLSAVYHAVVADPAMPTTEPAPAVPEQRRRALRRAQQESLERSYDDPSRPPRPA